MLDYSLREEVKTHGCPSTLVVWITELETTLEAEKKHHLEASDVVIVMTRRA